jgi:hypothetical protein
MMFKMLLSQLENLTLSYASPGVYDPFFLVVLACIKVTLHLDASGLIPEQAELTTRLACQSLCFQSASLSRSTNGAITILFLAAGQISEPLFKNINRSTWKVFEQLYFQSIYKHSIFMWKALTNYQKIDFYVI